MLFSLCHFSDCLLLFLCLGPAGTLKHLFLSIQMFRHLPPEGAPRLPKSAPRPSQRRRLWLLCGTSGGFAAQTCLEKPMMFKDSVLLILLSFLSLFSVCPLFLLCLGPAGKLKPLFLSSQMLRHLPPTSAPRAS